MTPPITGNPGNPLEKALVLIVFMSELSSPRASNRSGRYGVHMFGRHSSNVGKIYEIVKGSTRK